jgi:uncharacterized membrane protein
MINREIFILGIVLLLLDYVYISTFSNHFKEQIYKVQKQPLKMNIRTTILCYFLLILGLYYFILKENKSLKDAFLLGIFVYGVYELTTMSLLKDWKLSTVIIDTIWGGILFALTIYITRSLLKM